LRYGAPPRPIDFRQAGRARSIINAWVKDQTHARITDLIPPGAPDGMTSLVLCDAIYFWGAWQDSFPSRETANAPFHLTSHDAASVPFMRFTHIRRHMENRDLQMLELPYRGRDHTMLVVLPKAVDGLAAIEKRLDPDSLAGWIARLENAVVQLTLPKFKVESGLNLARLLRAMGMPDAFGVDADFSGIAPERPLFISDVYHKAFVAVDEHGTEASAASAVVMTMGALAAPARTVNFTADHPFLFLIRHRPSGTILFMGRVADPR
jgi:serpin B